MVGFNEKKFETISGGTHAFRCYAVIDLGTQSVEFQGEVKRSHLINFMFEFPNELMESGKPFSMKAAPFHYALSNNPKSKLMALLKSWLPNKKLGDGFDFGELIGQTGMANIVVNDKGYANIVSVMPLPKGTQLPALPDGAKTYNDPTYVSLDEKWDAGAFDRLSDYWKNIIQKSPEYEAIGNVGLDAAYAKAAAALSKKDEESEIPF